MLRTAAKEASAGVPLVVHGVVDSSASNLEFQLAGFLLTATSNYSYFGASSSFQDAGWTWHKEYDVVYGVPVGELQQNGSWYHRELRNYNVHLDCTKDGEGAQILRKFGPDQAIHEQYMAQRFIKH